MTIETTLDVQSSVVQAVARLSDRALARLVGANAYLRGRVYARQSCVHDLVVKANEAGGRVHGRASDPYDVQVFLSEEGGLTSKCNCPAWRGVDRHCKHVAAVLVALRDRVRPSRGANANAEGTEGSTSDAPPPMTPNGNGAANPTPSGASSHNERGRNNHEARADGGNNSNNGNNGNNNRRNADRDKHANRDRDGRHGKNRRRDEGSSREVVVVDRGSPRVVSAGGSTTVQSVSVSSSGMQEQPRGFTAWVPANEPKKAPEFEYRVHVRSNSIGITPYLAENRTPVPPSDAFEMLGALSSPHRAILRLLAKLHPKSARGAQVEARGEEGAELVSRLRGKRVLVEPMLMELRYVDEPLVPRLELEMVPPTQVRVRAVFERKTSDARRFQLSQGLWLEGEPGWHIDPIQGVARPLADFVTPVLLERLLKTQAVNYPTSDVARLLSEHLPKVCLSLNAPLPDIRAIVDEIDTPPKFVLRAAGDLTRVIATLDVHYGTHEFPVPPVELPPPLVILNSDAGGRPKCLRRDIGAEHGAMRELLEGGLEVTDDFRALQAEGESAIRFWSECVPKLPREWEKYVPEHLVNVRVRSAPVTPRARVNSGLDWLSVDVEFGSEGSRASEDELRRALEMGSKLVRLEDGTYARLEGEQVREVLTRMSEIYASGKSAQIPLSQAGRVQDLLDTLGQRAQLGQPTKDFFAALGEHKVEAVEPPKELNATMRPYQLEGFSWLAYLYRTGTGGILADDMGLGKTLQAITLLLWAKRLQTPAPEVDESKKSKTVKTKKTAKAAKEAVVEEEPEPVKPVKKAAKKGAKKADSEEVPTVIVPVAAPDAVALEHSGPLALVIAPTSVVTNWVREVQKFAPGLRAIAWTGSDRSKYKADIEKADVIVTSYALLRRDEEFLSAIEWGFVILDEAQSIKNPTSATARAAKNLKGCRRLALTGTPIENRLSEIWSIFDFVSPGLLPTLGQFEERYARPIDRGDEDASRRLRTTIHPFVLRRTKIEVAKDLPEKIVTERVCEMPAEQTTVYKTVLKSVRDSIYGEVEANGLARSQLQILAGLTRLRQAACDPRLLSIPGTYTDETSGKLVALKDLLTEAQQGGHRTLVFSQFVTMLQLIKAMLEQEGIAYEYIDGDTKDRQSRVDRFNRDDKIPVFLISLKAGGTGLNLTGADTVVHFDPWWNPAVEDQATDRAHRIGQTRVVTAYRFVAKGTIEEKIIELSAKKRELVENVLGQEQDEKVAGILTRAELDKLFADD